MPLKSGSIFHVALMALFLGSAQTQGNAKWIPVR